MNTYKDVLKSLAISTWRKLITKAEAYRFHPFSRLPLRKDEVLLVVDVGAYCGHYTSLALKAYPNSKVIAYEPATYSAALFRKAVMSSLNTSKRVTFHNAAVSSKKGFCTFNLTSYGPANSIETQSKEHQRQNPSVREVSTELVDMVTLDQTVPAGSIVDVLKIDVEGHELSVIRGAREVLKRTRFLIIEVSLTRDKSVDRQSMFELFAILKAADFYLYSLIDICLLETPGPHLGMAQFDAIFKNSNY